MIADFFAWLPGPLAYDIFAIIGTLVLLVLFVGLPVWAFLDRFRPSHGEHYRPIGEAAAVVAVPAEVVEPRSPFRRKREAK
jgi:hypothetical protein